MTRFDIFLFLCALQFSLPLNAFVVDGLSYEKTGAGTVELVAQWPSYSGVVNVPQTVADGGVTYTVTSIGAGAFRNAEFLTSVTLPASIVSIGSNAFENCKKLGSIQIPSSVSEMGMRVFSGCSSLVSVSFKGTNLTEIPNSAFYRCSNLKNIVLPENITTIRSLSFAESGLQNISICKSLKCVEPFAFDGCKSIVSVSITDMRSWCDIDFSNATDNPLYYARTMYLNNVPVEKLEIPDGVTRIKPFVFAGSGAKTVSIPPSVKTIDMSAFISCLYITNFIIPNSVTELDVSNLRDGDYPMQYVASVQVGKGIKEIPADLFYYRYRLAKLILLDGLREIGNGAFRYSKIANLVLPRTLTTLKSSFGNCANLEVVTINSGLQVMDHGVFSMCKNLREIHCEVVNPTQVQFVGSGQFDGVDTENCVLYVPKNSIALYKANPNWKIFKNIVADIPMPDVNRSGMTDVEDINCIVNTILKEENPGCNSVAADVNHDGIIDVADVNEVINGALHL